MAKKLTKEEINHRLASKGIMLIGDYAGTKTKSIFRCKYGHQWMAVVGHGCPHCDGQAKLTRETVNERIKHRDIEMIGEYVNNKTKTTFRGLICGHEWVATPSKVINADRGCHKCNMNHRLTREQINERIKNRDLVMISEVINTSTQALFKHLVCGNEWEATPSNVMRVSGCPNCANVGYNPSEAGYVYVISFGDFVKYGITNNLSARLAEHHKRNGNYSIIYTKLYKDGKLARQTETQIKRTLGGRYASKEECPDGYTETLPSFRLDELLSLLNGTGLVATVS